MKDHKLLILYEHKLREIGNILYQNKLINEVERLKLFFAENPIKKEVKIKDNKDISTDIYEVEFDVFRKLYPSTKKSLKTEFNNFKKKHKDWKECLNLLMPSLEKEIIYKSELILYNQFCPEWKHLSTWINQRCWEQEFSTDFTKFKIQHDEKNTNNKGASIESIAEVINKHYPR
jgi:hypothetical protein